MSKGYDYKPGGLLLNATLALLALHLVILVVSVGSSAMQYALLNRIDAGIEVSEAETTANDLREATIGFLSLGIFVILGITFLCTLYRANANVHAMGARGLEFTPGWTVGWFFIPILNLFRPYQAVRETWRASDPTHRDWKQNQSSPILPIWWALWILSSIADRVAFASTSSATTLSQLKNATLIVSAVEVIGLILTGVAAVLLYRLFAMQEQRREQAIDGVRTCPSCGEGVAAQVSVCSVCGESLDFVAQPA